MKTNKVIRYYQQEIRFLQERVSKACKDYTDTIEAKIRFYMKWGYVNVKLQEREGQLYLKYASLVCRLIRLQDKYYQVKGVELCQEESR